MKGRVKKQIHIDRVSKKTCTFSLFEFTDWSNLSSNISSVSNIQLLYQNESSTSGTAVVYLSIVSMNCCYYSKILAFKQLLCICTMLLSPFLLGETAICRIPQVFVCSIGLNVEGKIKKGFLVQLAILKFWMLSGW